MKLQDAPKFDALVIGEFTIDYMTGASVSIKATAAFVSTESGATHGWTKGEGAVWSEETLARLRSLKESMEQDLVRLHFGGSASTTQKPGVRFEGEQTGLGEHVGGDAPSV